MELQLALSLFSSSASSSSHFDLNNHTHEALQGKPMFECMKIDDLKKRKLSINGDEEEEEEEEEFHVPETLPLLFFNNNNQEHDDDDDHHHHDADEVDSTFTFSNHKNGGEYENDVIGWPPVKSSRKKVYRRKNHGEGGEGGGGSKSVYVKVQMEGDGIARKIDLNLHHSYSTLVYTLVHMFGKNKQDVTLTYQDKEGDWLLATDVPWGSFMETVQRLKLLRGSC